MLSISERVRYLNRSDNLYLLDNENPVDVRKSKIWPIFQDFSNWDPITLSNMSDS